MLKDEVRWTLLNRLKELDPPADVEKAIHNKAQECCASAQWGGPLVAIYHKHGAPELLTDEAVWYRLFMAHDGCIEFDVGAGLMVTMWYHKARSSL